MKQIPVIIVLVTFILASCSNTGIGDVKQPGEKITQQADGTISLKLEKASFYNCDTDPSNNTAEWNFIVSRPGRYGVWLSTATTDTMNLKYASSVKISLQDERIEAKPVGDKIVLNAKDVKYPYYRADSYIGTFYIEQPGEYSIQVISEKVLPESKMDNVAKNDSPTRMMSVVLLPMTR
jgi:predicted small secreted protein